MLALLFAFVTVFSPKHPASVRPRVTPPVITVVAHDFAFTIPDSRPVPAGPVTFQLINRGKELHMMGITWLGKHTFSEFMAAVRADSTFAGAYEVGGPNAVAPGDSSSATVMLEPGHAAIACWVVSADGKMHVLKGMTAPLEVVAAGAHTATVPISDDTITLRDYAVAMSHTPASGRHTFRVENRGPSGHDVQLFRMEPHATMQDVDAWLRQPEKGSPRARPLGGMVGLDHGHHGWFTADLVPGDYVFLCWMPDDKGVPHYSGHGMLTRFHVGPAAETEARVAPAGPR